MKHFLKAPFLAEYSMCVRSLRVEVVYKGNLLPTLVQGTQTIILFLLFFTLHKGGLWNSCVGEMYRVANGFCILLPASSNKKSSRILSSSLTIVFYKVDVGKQQMCCPNTCAMLGILHCDRKMSLHLHPAFSGRKRSVQEHPDKDERYPWTPRFYHPSETAYEDSCWESLGMLWNTGLHQMRISSATKPVRKHMWGFQDQPEV